MIHIVYGKAKSGKTHHIYSEIYQMMDPSHERETIYLIVPEQYTLEAEKQLIEFSKAEGFIGIEVVSFKRLAHKVFSETEQIEGVKVSDIGQIMMLRHLFIQNSAQLQVYKKAHDKYGFLTQFYDMIREFKQNMITPEQLDLLIHSLEESSLLGSKLKDFNTVFKAYEAEKSGKYFDDEDFYDALLSRIATAKSLKNAMIYIDGFDSFTVQELAILSELSQKAKQMTLSICSDGKLDASLFMHTNTLFRRMIDISKENKIEVKTTECNYNAIKPDIAHISENLLVYPYQKKEINKADVQLFSAENRLVEVEYCASQILKLVREDGYKWQDFAVITNDLDAYSISVKRIFDEFKLPHFIDSKVSVSTNPLVHLMMSYLKMHIESFAPEQVMRLVQTGFFKHDETVCSGFELYIKQHGVREKKMRLPFEAQLSDGRDLIAINNLREQIVSIIAQPFKEKKMTTKIAIQCLYEMLVKLEVKQQIDEKVQMFTALSELNLAQQYAQIWNLTMDLFDQLVTLMGDEELTLLEFAEILESGFNTMEVGILPLNDNQVLVGSLDRSKSHPIKVLFFLGMNDGIVPESGNDRQLLLDSEKSMITEKGLRLISDSIMFANKEQFNIYFALTRPAERLFFSFSRADAEGATIRPSYFISKLMKICPNLKMNDEHTNMNDELTKLNAEETPTKAIPYKISSEMGTIKHLSNEMRRDADGYPISETWRLAFLWYSKNNSEMANLLLNGLNHSNLVEKLDSKSIESVYNLPLTTSVSKLEQFVMCPFKYFIESGIQPLPQKNFELRAPDIGTLFHSVLEHFGKEVFKRKLNWANLTQSESNQLIEEIIGNLTNSDIFSSKFQYKYLVQKLNRVSKKAAWTLTRQLASGEFRPKAFEVNFGGAVDSVAPIGIPLKDGSSMLIRGVIDRVDLLEVDALQYIRIIDYKSGNKSLSLSDIYNGLQMQLMVYLNACLENPDYFNVTSLEPAGAFYFKIEDPLIESTDISEESVDSKISNELRMDGIALDQATVLKGFDAQLFDDKSSKVIQVRIKNDGEFTKDSKIVPVAAFKGMVQYVKSLMSDVGNEITEGKIQISPCKTGQFVSCNFCDYQAICQFDSTFKGNQYRKIPTFSNEDVIQKLKEYPDGKVDL